MQTPSFRVYDFLGFVQAIERYKHVRGCDEKLMESHDSLVNYYGVFFPQLHDLCSSSKKLYCKSNTLGLTNVDSLLLKCHEFFIPLCFQHIVSHIKNFLLTIFASN